MFSFQCLSAGNVDHEELAVLKVEIEGHRQRLLQEVLSADNGQSPKTKANAEKVISWFDPNILHQLRCRSDLSCEIIIELNTADQMSPFCIEIEEREAYVWIDFKTIPPIQFRIPFELC